MHSGICGAPPNTTVWNDASELAIQGAGWSSTDRDSPHQCFPSRAKSLLCSAEPCRSNCSVPSCEADRCPHVLIVLSLHCAVSSLCCLFTVLPLHCAVSSLCCLFTVLSLHVLTVLSPHVMVLGRDVDLEAPLHISELNRAIVFLRQDHDVLSLHCAVPSLTNFDVYVSFLTVLCPHCAATSLSTHDRCAVWGLS